LQSDANVLISGDFTTVNGVVRRRVARLYGDSAFLEHREIERARDDLMAIVLRLRPRSKPHDDWRLVASRLPLHRQCERDQCQHGYDHREQILPAAQIVD